MKICSVVAVLFHAGGWRYKHYETGLVVRVSDY